jgi:hypothetical protein
MRNSLLNYSFLSISIAIIGTTISTILIAISIYYSGNYYTRLSIAAIVLIILDLLLITFNKKSIENNKLKFHVFNEKKSLQLEEYDILELLKENIQLLKKNSENLEKSDKINPITNNQSFHKIPIAIVKNNNKTILDLVEEALEDHFDDPM